MELKGLLIMLHLIAAVIWIGGIFFMQFIIRAVVSDSDAAERIRIMNRVFKHFFKGYGFLLRLFWLPVFP